jgi:hypothetical protein
MFLYVLEPIPSTMDNWGEGVVPACREEHPQRFSFFLINLHNISFIQF